ncbi:MAG TPA: RNA methyltransferase [Planctomycetes bacterium]|nr:RNA methyltransferase [Planctomycetota bacterium]
MREPLTSLQNPRAKRAVRLRDRRSRDREGCFIIEGFRELRRAVQSRLPLEEVFFCRQFFLGENEPRLVADAVENCAATAVETGEGVFRKISYRDRPDGLLAIAAKPNWSLERLEVAGNGPPMILVAQAIEKPGNLGTLLRTCDAAGVTGVMVVDSCTDIFNPNVVRASVGTLFTVPIIETTSEEAMRWLVERKIMTVATSPDAKIDYSAADLTGPLALVVGSEQYGLDEGWLSKTDTLVRIPMAGSADSLNVAVANAVVLFEAVRQRRISAHREGLDS